jgi:serine/threonine protein kinase
LIELLGRGGMGEVWRAHDTDTDRTVAIKVLPANLSEDEEFQRRFRREAHAAARLNSPHVIPIHQYGEIDGRLYVDMRLIEGHDLETVLADGPLDPARAVTIVGQVAKALHAAHKVGLLHRDIKPSNILVDDDDFAYLIDFGIARALDETRMTKSGYAIGTFQYIAPERLGIGSDEDARADIYSLACVLYQCLTGSPPFPGETMAHLVAAHLNSPPPRPSVSQPAVPAPVDEVIARGMAKDPDERYATTVELANAAREAITKPIQRPDPSPITRLAYAREAGSPPSRPPAPPTARRRAKPLEPTAARSRPSGLQNRRPSSAVQPNAMPSRSTRAAGVSRVAWLLFILGGVLLVAGYFAGVPLFWTIGVLLLVVGFVMMAVGWARRTGGDHRPG